MNIGDFEIGDTICFSCHKIGGHPENNDICPTPIYSFTKIDVHTPFIIEGEYEDITNKKDIPRLENNANGKHP